eukprot:Hpha_TRINITY_DN15170_c3_g8::TRINITY_DN15170_c3_g8_i3::g.129071::m.129071/K07750/E1.14.13.72, SC4MOL, ERG25; methylsterol monooxygenase
MEVVGQVAEYGEWMINNAFVGWTPANWAMYCVGIFVAMGAHGLMLRTPAIGWMFGAMPFKGKILRDEDLGLSDYGFVLINKSITCVYVYHATHFFREAEWLTGKKEDLTALNSICAALLALGVYDSIYVPFHRALHLPGLYPLIHKHHHKQINPFRSLYDGINTHPFEFICGEYLHLLSLWVTGQLLAYAGLKFHVAGVVGFLLVTASLAPLNHTRWTMRVPFLFDTRTHDTHHKYPRSNYCQYVPWWDHLYGSFIPYNRDTAAIARSRGVEASTKSA